jgi:DNA-binding winged helix-turn-helix (wHTH) protein
LKRGNWRWVPIAFSGTPFDVLLEYVAKYANQPDIKPPPTVKVQPERIPFAGGSFSAAERSLFHGVESISVTPREINLIEALTAAEGEVVSYETLYSEILGRRFSGDTSNMRVLLLKLATSADKIGMTLRQWIDVIPKNGYRYRKPTVGAKKAGGRKTEAGNERATAV